MARERLQLHQSNTSSQRTAVFAEIFQRSSFNLSATKTATRSPVFPCRHSQQASVHAGNMEEQKRTTTTSTKRSAREDNPETERQRRHPSGKHVQVHPFRLTATRPAQSPDDWAGIMYNTQRTMFNQRVSRSTFMASKRKPHHASTIRWKNHTV